MTESRDAFLPGPILLMGAPGVGKGTQAKELVSRWSIPQVSTGDLLRNNVSTGSALGLEAKGLMDAGILVSDDLVNRMVKERLGHPDTARGYILDGYPRTLGQAEWLDGQLEINFGRLDGTPTAMAHAAGVHGAAALPLVAVSLVVEYTQLLRRITGRRICPVCGSIYNIYLQPPSRAGVCDLEGSLLECRTDDSEAVFTSRMQAYEQLTAPVLGHYEAQGRLLAVDGMGEPGQVTARVEAAVRQLRNG